MVLSHFVPKLSVFYGIKNNGKIIVLGIQFFRRHMQAQPFMVNPDFFIGKLYPEHAFLVGALADDSYFFVRIHHHTVPSYKSVPPS